MDEEDWSWAVGSESEKGSLGFTVCLILFPLVVLSAFLLSALVFGGSDAALNHILASGLCLPFVLSGFFRALVARVSPGKKVGLVLLATASLFFTISPFLLILVLMVMLGGPINPG